MSITRRDVLSVAGGAAASIWATQGCRANAIPAAAAPSAALGNAAPPTTPLKPITAFAPGTHAVLPLPFDATKLTGISEKMIVSHHDNNYAGAVKNLNKLEADLAQIGKDTPGYVVGGLKERELLFANSMVLHELYFANLGGNGKASGAIEKALADAYGGFAKWEEHFRATGASLGGGSGWAMLDWDLHADAPRTYWSSNHTQTAAAGLPLLVMDMYEHSYAIDYGAAAPKYIDAFFANIQWDEVNRRLERARRASAALRA